LLGPRKVGAVLWPLLLFLTRILLLARKTCRSERVARKPQGLKPRLCGAASGPTKVGPPEEQNCQQTVEPNLAGTKARPLHAYDAFTGSTKSCKPSMRKTLTGLPGGT